MSARGLLLLATILTPVALLDAGPPQSLKLITTLSLPGVEGKLDHLTADVKGGRLFVAAQSNNTIEVIDARTITQIETIKGLEQPQDLAYVPASNRLLVANGADGSVRTYDGTSFKLLKREMLGGDADHIRVDDNQGRIFVGYGAGALAVLDSQEGRWADIKVGGHPESFQIETRGSRLFVNLPGVHQIAVFDRKKETPLAVWYMPYNYEHSPMALDEFDKRLFVVSRNPAKLMVLNTDTGAVITTMSTVGDADDVFYDRRRQRIYVTGGAGAVAIYQQKEANHYWEIERVRTTPGGRTGLFVPEWNRLFVASRAHGPDDPPEIRVFEVEP